MSFGIDFNGFCLAMRRISFTSICHLTLFRTCRLGGYLALIPVMSYSIDSLFLGMSTVIGTFIINSTVVFTVSLITSYFFVIVAECFDRIMSSVNLNLTFGTVNNRILAAFCFTGCSSMRFFYRGTFGMTVSGNNLCITVITVITGIGHNTCSCTSRS